MSTTVGRQAAQRGVRQPARRPRSHGQGASGTPHGRQAANIGSRPVALPHRDVGAAGWLLERSDEVGGRPASSTHGMSQARTTTTGCRPGARAPSRTPPSGPSPGWTVGHGAVEAEASRRPRHHRRRSTSRRAGLTQRGQHDGGHRAAAELDEGLVPPHPRAASAGQHRARTAGPPPERLSASPTAGSGLA